MSRSLIWVAAVTVGGGLGLIGAWLSRPRVTVLERRLAAMFPAPGSQRSDDRSVWQRLLQAMGSRLGRVLGGADEVRHRLERAGHVPDVAAFRTSQALWAVYGLAMAAAVVAVSGASTGTRPLHAGGLMLVAAASGVVLRDQELSRAANRRDARMMTEFPTVADMLALAVAAGQGPLGAIEQVTRLCSGPLAEELAQALREARAGRPLADALEGVARRTSALSITRFIEGIIVALERGTPLADVLRAQAQDAREAARAQLIEVAGKKEILMMAPVVFLILPVTVLFAVYPGMSALQFQP